MSFLLVQLVWFFAPLVAILLAYPWLAKRLMQPRPITDPELRQRIAKEVEARPCVSADNVLVWITRGQLSNAAVIGAISWNQFLVLTDGLLLQLDDNAVMAMVRHELAHASRWHGALRVLLVMLPLWSWLWIRAILPDQGQVLLENASCSLLGTTDPWTIQFFVLPIGLTCLLRIALALVARVFEHDADLDACGIYKPNCSREERRTAYRQLKAALENMAPTAERDRSSWLHPSVNERLVRLQRALDEPDFGPATRLHAQMLGRAICFGFVLGPLAACLLR